AGRAAKRRTDHHRWRACGPGDQRRYGTAGLPDRRQQPGQPDFPWHRPEQSAATAARRGMYRLAGLAARWSGDTGQPPLARTRLAPVLSLGKGIFMKALHLKGMTLIMGCVLLFAGLAQAAEKPVIR